jgi:hypothetical protein
MKNRFTDGAATSSLNHSQQDNHNSDYQQNMNETAHGVRRNQTQQPQDEHYNGKGIEHDIYSFNLLRYAYSRTYSADSAAM